MKESILIQVGPAGASGGIADVMHAIDRWARANHRRTVVVNTSSDSSWLKRALAGCLGVYQAFVWIRKSPDAIVHVHSASNGSFVRKSVVVAMAWMLGRPILLHIHGGGFSSFVTSGTWPRKVWISAVLRRADAVCVVSEPMKQTIGRLEPSVRTRVLPNPATLVCGHLTDPNSRQVLFLGRLGLTKGTDTLLEAIRRLQSAGIEADYLLAGDGDVEGARLEASRLPAPDRIHVTGWLDAAVVHRLLHQSSIFCLPSRFEGVPMALLQAMGHGLACVVTPVGGMREVVADGVTGILVPQDDPEAVAAAIGALLEDVRLRASLGRAAAVRVAQSYALDTFFQRLDEMYSDVLARRRESSAI